MSRLTAVSADVRRRNAAVVFHEILKRSQCSRAELRAATGLVSGSVTTIVNELAQRGLVSETGETTSTVGRPRRLVKLNENRVLGAVSCLTRDSLDTSILNLAGEILWQQQTPLLTEQTQSETLLDTLANALDQAQEFASQFSQSVFTGSAVTVQGPVVEDSTVIVVFGLPLNHVDLEGAIRERLRTDQPIQILNDGRMGALAEYAEIPSEERPHVMAYISSRADGVAGGLVEDGHIYGGEHGLAGEVGHIITNAHGIRCACGARGCLETVLTSRNLLTRAGGQAWSPASLSDENIVDQLVEQLESNNPQALAAVSDGGQELAAAIATLSTLTDVGTVVLGGDLAKLSPWISPEVEHVIAEKRKVSPIFYPTTRPAALGSEAVMRGAWLRMRNRVAEDPFAIEPLT